MSMRIKNWNEFQHYKDRCPPWLKLYRRLIDDVEFMSLDGECVKTLVLLWILAAEDPKKEGNLPSVEKIAFRLRIDSGLLAKQLSQLKHWVTIDDSIALAGCKQLATPETERETDTETKRETKTKPPKAAYTDEFLRFWVVYPKKKAKAIAAKEFEKAKKRGMPKIDLLLLILGEQIRSHDWVKEGGKYIPKPQNWIKGDCWEDEITPDNGQSEPVSRVAQQQQQNMEVIRNYVNSGNESGDRYDDGSVIDIVSRPSNGH